jgi:hypothetical protein
MTGVWEVHAAATDTALHACTNRRRLGRSADRPRHRVGRVLPACGLQVDGFPKPSKVHFEWYIPNDEHHHYYMILHAGYDRTIEERYAFYNMA